MELNLQPLAQCCFVSGDPFQEGERVVSHLLRSASLEITRYDVGEARVQDFQPEGTIVCSWVHPYKPKAKEENTEHTLKLTAENLFVTLADPLNEPTPENTRLMQFLALMLERKRLLRPKGRNQDGTANVYEHAKSKLRYEVPVGELDPEFFLAVQAQLSVLVGSPETSEVAVATAPGNEPVPE
ncbi:MAG: hypothetical protein K9M98_07010 [Cephaloticoccus sp.]|nr:hypothetical protein [Cephaloticoccus sp.]MCF7760238.1 hypothetical protein [Cephaloticoccus sp.]